MLTPPVLDVKSRAVHFKCKSEDECKLLGCRPACLISLAVCCGRDTHRTAVRNNTPTIRMAVPGYATTAAMALALRFIREHALKTHLDCV